MADAAQHRFLAFGGFELGELLFVVGLEEFTHAHIHELSGGMKQAGSAGANPRVHLKKPTSASKVSILAMLAKSYHNQRCRVLLGGRRPQRWCLEQTPERHALQIGRRFMEYVVITLTPEILNLNPVVHGPFETLDEAEEFLERWINFHPGAHGIVRRLIRPFETPGDELYDKKRSRVVESCSRLVRMNCEAKSHSNGWLCTVGEFAGRLARVEWMAF